MSSTFLEKFECAIFDCPIQTAFEFPQDNKPLIIRLTIGD